MSKFSGYSSDEDIVRFEERREVETRPPKQNVSKESLEVLKILEGYKSYLVAIPTLIELMSKFVQDNQRLLFMNEIVYEFKMIEHEVDDLVYRFSKNSYEIAVMGLEKSGKTTLINAILGISLLPAKRGRCTYVPTELRSCASVDQERIEIEYLSLEEFENHKKEVEKVLQKNGDEAIVEFMNDDLNEKQEENVPVQNKSRKLKKNEDFNNSSIDWVEEYKEIKEVEITTRKYLGKPKEIVRNDKNVNYEERITETVSDPGIARAVKRVVLYTTHLKLGNDESEVTLYDVPGYDSPFIMHKKQSKENASKSDAIIFVKKFESPSLKQVENHMLKMFEASGGFVPLKEKMIVAVSSVDVATTQKDFKDNLELIKLNFEKKNIKSERVFPICSAAKQVSYSRKSNDEEKEAIYKQAKEKLKILKITDGIEELKTFIRQFVNDFRFKNLMKSFYQSQTRFKEKLKLFIEESKSEFNVSDFHTETKEESFENQKERQKLNWYAHFLPNAMENFQVYFTKTIFSKSDPDVYNEDPEFLVLLKQKYFEIVNTMAIETEEWLDNRANEIWIKQAHNCANIAPGEAHSAIRKDLAEETLKKITEYLTKGLSSIVWQTVKKMLDFILAEMFFIDEIKDTLLNNSESNYKNILSEKIEILILRLARPTIDLFLRFPREDNRLQTIDLYKNEVMILDMFYKEGSATKRGLPFYLANGKEAAKKNESLEFNVTDLPKSDSCEDFSSATSQIRQDIQEFFLYMKNSIFYASGIEAFFKQELDKIAFRFRTEDKNHGTWHFLVFKSIASGNPKITNEILEQFDFDVTKKNHLMQSLKDIDDFLKNLSK